MEKGEMTGSLEESTTTEQAVRHPDVVLEAESETRSKAYRVTNSHKLIIFLFDHFFRSLSSFTQIAVS